VLLFFTKESKEIEYSSYYCCFPFFNNWYFYDYNIAFFTLLIKRSFLKRFLEKGLIAVEKIKILTKTKSMKQRLAQIAIVVKDYDGAIDFYVNKLHFDLVEDTVLDAKKRWVLVRPSGTTETCLLLAKAANEEQASRIGNQAGGRVFLFLFTDDFERDYQNLIAQEIEIIRPPTDFEYGRVAVFADLYGNLWDLIQPTDSVFYGLRHKII